jgi:hypothetical protein
MHQAQPGSSPREGWEEHPFRNVPRDEDVWFHRDRLRLGGRDLRVGPPEIYLALRHRGSQGNRVYTWVSQLDGSTVEEYLHGRPLYQRSVEQLLPDWVLERYRTLRQQILAGQSQSHASTTGPPLARPRVHPVTPRASAGGAPYPDPRSGDPLGPAVALAGFADLIVSVDGWLIHAAYLLGKPFRMLKLHLSGTDAWQPYGRTHRQRIEPGLPSAVEPGAAFLATASLPDDLGQQILALIQRETGSLDDPRLQSLL